METRHRSLGPLVVLTRDVFGYLFAGVVFLIIAEVVLGFLGGIREQILAAKGDYRTTQSIVILLGTIAAGYPVGRILFGVGNSVCQLIPGAGFGELYWVVSEEIRRDLFGADAPPLEAFDGIEVTRTTAYTVYGRMLRRLILETHPQSYYLWIERPNVIRLTSETFLGLTTVSGGLVLLELLYDAVTGRGPWGLFVGGALVIVALFAAQLAWSLENRDTAVRSSITTLLAVQYYEEHREHGGALLRLPQPPAAPPDSPPTPTTPSQ